MDYKEHFHSLIDEGKYDDAFAYLKRFPAMLMRMLFILPIWAGFTTSFMIMKMQRAAY